MHDTITTRVYDGGALPPMSVTPPVYKPQSPRQRGVQPDRTLRSQNQWFTKTEAAKLCIQTTKDAMRAVGKDWRDYIIVEPSAGDGRFYNLLPRARRIGIDLAPQIDGVVRHDFLKWSPAQKGKYAVVGNPPFGVRGDLASAFIKRSAMFADICAFILPIGFMDEQRSYFSGFDLIHSEALPADIFVNVLGHESKSAGQGAINTCFNVWSAGASKRPPVCDYVCDDGVRVTACNFPQDPAAFIKQHNLFVKARYYGQTKVSAKFDEVRSRKSYYVVGIKADKEHLDKIKTVDWRRYHTKAMNGSFSITLKNAKRALCDLGLAHRVTTGVRLTKQTGDETMHDNAAAAGILQ